ncbi:hypothetical protein RDI58_000770 [Solanum bulbocastanum]|uniref:Reverse transcriptase zinc-binding domain-containing protein n=1 Tax=Solanum bulbocastanum TaxID=147425 RepID=A0AAN8UD04_SOLBU
MGSSWNMIRQIERNQLGIMNIWEKGIPLRISFMLWRMQFQEIHVLVKNRIADSGECWYCSDSIKETFDHLFVCLAH